MRAPASRLALLALAAVGGCAPRAPGARRPRTDQSLITQDQIRAQSFHTAYEAVATMRSHWLRPRGPDSFNTPSNVVVYLNNGRLGSVDLLRGIGADVVVYIRHYDGIAAGARWGIGHGQGVIYVSTVEGGQDPWGMRTDTAATSGADTAAAPRDSAAAPADTARPPVGPRPEAAVAVACRAAWSRLQ